MEYIPPKIRPIVNSPISALFFIEKDIILFIISHLFLFEKKEAETYQHSPVVFSLNLAFHEATACSITSFSYLKD